MRPSEITLALLSIMAAFLAVGCLELTEENGGSSSPGQSPPPAREEPLPAGSDWLSVQKAEHAAGTIDRDPEVARRTPLVRKDPEPNLPRLVGALVANKEDDFQRVRALHDWVARNIAYDVKVFRSGASSAVVDPYGVIRQGRAICFGYSQLFKLLCDMAHVECVVVGGYGRGYGFKPFEEGSLPYASDHAWNAVHIGDGWYLVDTTWDAGALGSDDVFSWGYSTGYLFTPPRIFLCTHYPQDPRWQLLDQPLDYDAFKGLPYLRGSFGKLGLEYTGRVERVSSVGAEHEIVFRCPPEADLTASLQPYPDAIGPGDAVITRREGDLLRVRVLFPSPGRYQLSLSSSDPDQRASSSPRWLGSLFFEASAGSNLRAPYLSVHAREIGLRMDAENGYTYRVGSGAQVTFSCPQEVQAMLHDSDGKLIQNHTSVDGPPDRRVARVTFPAPGEYALWISARSKKEKDTWEGIVSLTFVAQAASDLEYPQISREAPRALFALESGLGYPARVSGEAQLAFTAEGDVHVSLFDSSRKGLENTLLCQNVGNRHFANLRFPARGDYTAAIMTAFADNPNRYVWVASLHFYSETAGTADYPVVNKEANRLGFRLVGPLTGKLASGKEASFEVAGPPTGAVSVQVAGAKVPLAYKGGVFRGLIRASGSSIKVSCLETPEGRPVTLATYTVASR